MLKKPFPGSVIRKGPAGFHVPFPNSSYRHIQNMATVMRDSNRNIFAMLERQIRSFHSPKREQGKDPQVKLRTVN